MPVALQRIVERHQKTLPGLDQSYTEDSTAIRLQDVIAAWIADARGRTIFERRVPTHDVLHRELERDPLQVIVCRSVAGVEAERDVHRIPRRLDIAVIADGAWEAAASDGAAGRDALEIDIGRRADPVLVEIR